MALQANVESLKQEQKYSEAVSLLRDFEQQTESLELRSEVKFQKALLYLNHLNQLEKGFNLLEQCLSPAEAALPARLHAEASILKFKFAIPITQKWLNRWNDLLIQYFAEHQDFPKDLFLLGSENTKRRWKDAYGFAFVYRLEDHPAFAGEDALHPVLFSVGEDNKAATEDDLRPEIPDTLKFVDGLKLVDTFQEKEQWRAEICYLDNYLDRGSPRTQKIKESDTFLDYQVFGIAEEGVVLLKNQDPLILRK